MNKRSEIIDVLKGIGIISVVVGHAGVPGEITNFVYTYHLMVFFFVCGLAYNEKKYLENPSLYIGNKIRGIIPKYWLYNLFFIIFHNFFVMEGIASSTLDFYTVKDAVVMSLEAFMIRSMEQLMGPGWFLQPFLMGTCLFAMVYSFIHTRKISKTAKRVADILFTILSAGIGLWCHYYQLFISYELEDAFLTIPFIYLGVSVKSIDMSSIKTRYYMCITLAAILALWVLATHGLAGSGLGFQNNTLNNVIWFYPATFLGIVFCLSFAELLIRKTIYLKKLFIICGKNSFYIMALHLLDFKIIDVIYGRIKGFPKDTYSVFPRSFSEQFWWLYCVVGIVLPVFWGWLIHRKKANEM